MLALTHLWTTGPRCAKNVRCALGWPTLQSTTYKVTLVTTSLNVHTWASFPWQVLFSHVLGKKMNIFPWQGKLIIPAFGQGKFVHVYDRQEKHDKCTSKNSSMTIYGFGNKMQHWHKTNVYLINVSINSNMPITCRFCITHRFFCINSLWLW